MATKLKIVDESVNVGPPAEPIPFDIAPTRNKHSGWTAERQRKFIEHLSLTGAVGESAALVGMTSQSAYRLHDRPGAESFARAWHAALSLASTRLVAIAFERGVHGRSERIYKNGELVMERRIPSDYMLTWLISRLNPAQFGSSTAKAFAAATGDPCEQARKSMPELVASFTDVSLEQCPTESGEYLDERLGEFS